MMNKDEFNFLVINTEAQWGEGSSKENITITENGISLSLKEISHSYIIDTFGTDSTEPISFAFDSCNILYILDKAKKAILIFDLNKRDSYWIDCVSFPQPKSIAVSDSDIYVVYDNKISCLAKVNYQIRWEREITEDIGIALSSKNHLYLLNKDKDSKEVFKVDREWNSSSIVLKDSRGQLDNPVDIASSDAGNNIYILEASKNEILKFKSNGEFIETIPIHYEEGFIPNSLAVYSENIFLIFKDKSGIVRFQKIKKYEPSGIYITKVFDSMENGCEWHRVVLDADIPENTQVKISYYASDKNPDNNLSWSSALINPKDSLLINAKGRNIWFKISLLSDPLNLKTPLIKSLKVYFPRLSYLRYLPAIYQEDKNSVEFLERFLSLFETFMLGLEDEIYSFPKYLDASAIPDEFVPWLSSWLAISYDENWPLEKKRELIKNAVELYKKRGTRRAINELISLYTNSSPLYTNSSPIIVEWFQNRCLEKIENKELREEYKKVYNRLYRDCPYSFCVLLKPDTIKSESQLNTVRRIIQTEKPAHTVGGVILLKKWFYLDMHTYLGINTYLSKPEFVVGKSAISRDTVISEREESGQIDVRSRVEMDTILT